MLPRRYKRSSAATMPDGEIGDHDRAREEDVARPAFSGRLGRVRLHSSYSIAGCNSYSRSNVRQGEA